MKMCSRLQAVLAAALCVAGCGGEGDGDDAPPRQAMACARLDGMTIPAGSIGLATTGAVVTSAAVVPAMGAGPAAVGEYCRVRGAIHPVDPAAQAIRFQLNLPTAWNGKALMFGGAGLDGIVADGTGNLPAGPVDRPVPLGRGYATFGSDSGHQADPLATGREGAFAGNDEMLRNFAGDALKKTRDVALALIEARYASPPTRTYFAGGSTGGREALFAITRWPADFDGAIALYPAWNPAALNLQFGRITRALAQPGAYPSQAKRRRLLDAATAACDRLDGAADGLVSDVEACDAIFDPRTALLAGLPLRCPGGADTGDDCLSDAQIDAFEVARTPLELPYRMASGETAYPGFNTWGTDFGVPGDGLLQRVVTTLALGTMPPATPMPPVTFLGSPPSASIAWDQWIRFFVARDAAADPLAVDPQHPGALRSRILELTRLQDVNEANLSAFRARGGKLLMAHGAHDALVSPRATAQYLTRLRDTMGAERVDDFVRYYEIPGYGHAASSVFNAAWDSLAALERWVEDDVAPTAEVVADSAGVPGRTRPLCAWPGHPRHVAGPVDAAGSFVCALPRQPAPGHPAKH